MSSNIVDVQELEKEDWVQDEIQSNLIIKEVGEIRSEITEIRDGEVYWTVYKDDTAIAQGECSTPEWAKMFVQSVVVIANSAEGCI